MHHRTNFTQLPSREELLQILLISSRRQVPGGKECGHLPDFGPVIGLLDYLNIPSEIFSALFSVRALLEDGFLANAALLIEGAARAILDGDLTPETAERLDATYDYLAEEDPLQKADAIFVFGAKTPTRAFRAAELFAEGYSELLILSGNRPVYRPDLFPSEAEEYREILIARGVPEKAIIVEPRSLSMPDNVRSSLNLLDNLGVRPGSFMLVNSPYSQRRGWSHFRKYLVDELPLVRVNSATQPAYSRELWHRAAPGISVVLGEYVRMKIATILNSA